MLNNSSRELPPRPRTFSKKYLDLGAILSVSFDPFDMGKQAGDMALKLLDHKKVSDIPAERVRKVIVHKNNIAAKMLGIELKETGTRK